MAAIIEYTLLAGASYYDTRAEINRFPVPKDWSLLSRIPEVSSSGFEASTYKNALTNEIVISFAGTAEPIDWTANFGLALGNAVTQLKQQRRIAKELTPIQIWKIL